MTPEQCRAGRALLQWSQEDLEQHSAVAKKTIADFERGAQIPFRKTLRELEFALEAGGVELIPEQVGAGAGVRLKEAVPRLTRRRVSRFDRQATIVMSYQGREFQVRLSTNILDDVDRTNHMTEADLERSADAHMNMILIRAKQAVDAGRAGPEGVLQLEDADFPETK